MGWVSVSADKPDVALTDAQVKSSTDTTQGDVSGSQIANAIAAEAGAPPYIPVVSKGQTAFVLPSTPLNAQSVKFYVNGVEYRPPAISVSAANVTWNNYFVLSPTDDVRIEYI
jgi:hypothetical protein